MWLQTVQYITFAHQGLFNKQWAPGLCKALHIPQLCRRCQGKQTPWRSRSLQITNTDYKPVTSWPSPQRWRLPHPLHHPPPSPPSCLLHTAGSAKPKLVSSFKTDAANPCSGSRGFQAIQAKAQSWFGVESSPRWAHHLIYCSTGLCGRTNARWRKNIRVCVT